MIQLLLPDDIRSVIEDEEVEFKRGFYPMVHAFMVVAICVFTFVFVTAFGVFVTPTCINMCTSRVFVIQLHYQMIYDS